MGEDSRAVWGLLQRTGRSPRKSRVENSKGPGQADTVPLDTLAVTDAVLASGVASV